MITFSSDDYPDEDEELEEQRDVEQVELGSPGDEGTRDQQQHDYEQRLINEKVTSEDIRFVIATITKEAEYDEISIKQLVVYA